MNNRSRYHRESGNTILEFALSVMTLTFLFAGTFQYGYSFYVYNNIETSIRSAARFASIQPYPSASFVPTTTNVAVYGDVSPGASDTPVAPGLTASNIRVSVVMVNGAPSYVQVNVTGYQLNSIFGNWNLNDKPVAAFTYMGHYQP